MITASSLPPVPLPPPLVIKEKTVKGFFKAPAYDAAVLRPRAKIRAPIPSTAADVSNLPAPLENDPPSPPTSTRGREPETLADGQRQNMINGVWHCSNCGCPESIAVGRRKGPLGNKSQCGTCGKYWHRHRRSRPVEYNSDLEYHAALKRDAELARTVARRRRGSSIASAEWDSNLAAPPAIAPPPIPPPTSAPPPPTSAPNPPPVSVSAPPSLPPPGPGSISAPLPPTPTASAPPTTQPFAPTGPTPDGTAPVPPLSPRSTWVLPPHWLTTAMKAMQEKWRNDKFEVILRKVNSASTLEWRIKCLDCPGKLYTPGPGEMLSNYEVHLKNRLHRQRVNDRMGGNSVAPPS
ncbi:hypothetical protein B0H14DRAFT_3087545 [Mycena olivaceomarginata]|nr:hypothetical protein B0H14DRAFT_3087545 [Mycena olivaceomarginata]